MGQRHQIFIHIPSNPASTDPILASNFGKGKTTVLAFHNQWLYGQRALTNAANLINLNPSAFFYGPESRLWNSDVNAVVNQSMEEKADKSWLLNPTEPEMRSYFDQGDNNDGITIIDLVSKKYCFMEIDAKPEGDRPTNRQYKPISAKQYVEGYYGTTPETVSNYWAEQGAKKGLSRQQVANQDAIENQPFIDGLAGFEVLTWEEVAKIFPRMKKKLEKANLNPVMI